MLDDYPALWAVALILLLGFAILLAWAPGKIARDRDHPSKDAINLCGWLGGLFIWPLWLVAIVWAHTVPARAARKFAPPPKRPKGYAGATVLDMPKHFAPDSPPEIPEAGTDDDGPGRYRIRGVDKASKMDTTWHCQADSAANARVKAELEGIIVTSVERMD